VASRKNKLTVAFRKSLRRTGSEVMGVMGVMGNLGNMGFMGFMGNMGIRTIL
jgi:hypothetical protein